MPFRLTVAAGEKVFINGAVIGGGDKPLSFYLFNKAQVLRGREILKEEDADTLEKKLYFIVQMVYLFPEDADVNLIHFRTILHQSRMAFPEHSASLDRLATLVQERDYYRALKLCGRLFRIRFIGSRGLDASAGPSDDPATDARAAGG